MPPASTSRTARMLARPRGGVILAFNQPREGSNSVRHTAPSRSVRKTFTGTR
jgi:hypothetical protein